VEEASLVATWRRTIMRGEEQEIEERKSIVGGNPWGNGRRGTIV